MKLWVLLKDKRLLCVKEKETPGSSKTSNLAFRYFRAGLAHLRASPKALVRTGLGRQQVHWRDASVMKHELVEFDRMGKVRLCLCVK